MDVTEALVLLEEESQRLQDLIDELDEREWRTATPAKGWCVADQIAHLHWSDLASLQAVEGHPAFELLAEQMTDDDEFVEREAYKLAIALPQAELISEWKRVRAQLADALRSADPGAKIRWFGPSMRPVTMVAARVMETWAHGLDIFDAMGSVKPEGASLAAVVRLGVRTRDFSFRVRNLAPPEAPVYVEVDMPDTTLLTFDSPEAENRIIGSAFGFAAVVTQRRSVASVDLQVHGDVAQRWMQVAQAFAGKPTLGP